MESDAFAIAIQSFLGEVSSAKPTPGGGSVTAVVTALGCATAAMAATVAAKRRGLSAQEQSFLQRHVESINESRSYMLEMCKADERLFEDYLRVLRHSSLSPEAQPERKAALQRSIIAATEIPMRTANECVKTLERTRDVATFVRPKFLSDVGVSVLLLEAAGQAALLLVDANMHVIQDDSLSHSMANKRTHLGERLSELRLQIMREIGLANR
ncbi:cyclodeaminase/cyclohydrolase family protein [Alicyclobacillus mengziensis]|uniref:Cyclodeaminase/cyclohydrolase family protein n=1 Tax=Alicyclobacillus mengziensis TaxID=2931921 RepID=A0A9X7Z991_9BACL|nr:cyclodeaminase/cyclohydrolase family protein [Alicyclobacillus mengziensis]QSO49201.1 cyclodeaminase/cyclohydrolase family protein [Alicyclobacillus mengziensis]